MIRARRAALGVLALLAGSCSSPTSPPPAPAVTVTLIADVFPAARSVGVSDRTAIWVDWTEPIVPATVSDTTVRLMIDSRRISARLEWDASQLRLTITPLDPLALARTHTVEISPGVRTMAGHHLNTTFISQFTTRSLREPAHPQPGDGASMESPFVALAWDSTEFAGGRLGYTVYSGPDSAAVTARTTPRDSTGRPWLVRRIAWPLGATLYWAVTAHDRVTGEVSRGPTWRFSTLAASTPIDSIVVPLSDWGDYEVLTGAQHCFGTVFSSGTGRYIAAVRWDLRGVGERKLANAFVRLVATQDLRIGSSPRPTLLAVTDHWSACAIGQNGPPYPDPLGILATAQFTSLHDMVLSSDLLTAHLEANLRRGLPPGYLVRTTVAMDYKGAESNLVLYLYRTPAPVVVAASR